jgi:hypothetical protein
LGIAGYTHAQAYMYSRFFYEQSEILIKMRKCANILSLMVCIVFSVNTMCYSASSVAYTITVPEKNGKVIGRWDPSFLVAPDDARKDKPEFSVIVIEDAHDNFAAQKNLADIIYSVLPYGAEKDLLVGVEGGYGIIEYDQLRQYPVRRAREAASKDLMRKGYLGGAEHALISHAHPFEMVGIEDKELFIKNFRLFYRLEKRKEYSQEIIDRIKSVLRQEKKRYYEPELLAFDARSLQYQSGELELLDYIQFLMAHSDILHESSITYPNSALFIECVQAEQAIDRHAFEKEIKLLLPEDPRHLKDIPNEEFLSLFATIENKKDFPLLARQSAIISKFGSIDIPALTKEVDAVSYLVKKQLAGNKIENQLIESDVLLRLIESALTVRATRFQVRTLNVLLRKNPQVFQDLIHRYGPGLSDAESAGLEQIFYDACRFYEGAQERETAMCENLFAWLRRERKKIGVLIAGGFHTEGITQILQKNNVPYIRVRPHTGPITDGTGFGSRLTGELFPLAPFYTSYINGRYITGLVQTLSDEYGKHALYKAFDLEWMQTIISSEELAALLYLLIDDTALSEDVRHRIRSLFHVARSITLASQATGSPEGENDIDIWSEPIADSSQNELRMQRLVEILGLSEAEPSPSISESVGLNRDESDGSNAQGSVYASTDYMRFSRIGKDSYVRAVTVDKNGDYRADINTVSPDEVLERNVGLSRVSLKNPFLNAFRKLPENPIVIAFQKCALARAENAAPGLYTFDKSLGDLNAFVWEEKNLIAVDRMLYGNHAARPLLLFHEFGHYLIDRYYAEKLTNKMQIRCVEEDGTVVLYVKVWYQIYDAKSKMVINTTQLIPIRLSAETLDFIYTEKGDNEQEWMAWDQDPHYLLRVLQFELFHATGEETPESIQGLDESFTQQIRNNIIKRRAEKLVSIHKKIERLIDAINTHQYSRDKWANVRLRLEEKLRDIDRERYELSKNVVLFDEDKQQKNRSVELPSNDELVSRGIFLARPHPENIRSPEAVTRELTHQADLLDLYCAAQVQSGVDPKELYLEESIISEIGKLIRYIEKNGSTGNDRLDEILYLKPHKRKNKIIEILLQQSDISPHLVENQSVAMEMMVNTPLSLTHGTVAGGKSQIIVEAVKNILDEDGTKPVLVLSPQHKSTDELTERLFTESEYPVSRLGYDPMNFSEFVRAQCTIEWEHGQGRKNFEWRWDRVNKPFGTNKSVYLATHMGAFFELRKMFRDETFKRKIQNSIVIIDEAALINYPEFLIVLFLVRPSAVHVIGDHKQFNTYRLQSKFSDSARGFFMAEMTPNRIEALKRYQTSVFEQLTKDTIYKTILDVNFRCHKTVVEMIDYFYEDITLEAHRDEAVEEDTLRCFDSSDLLDEAFEEAVTVFDEKTGARHKSYHNVFEAEIIVDEIVKFLRKKPIAPSVYAPEKISVLTPYKGQEQLVKKLIAEDQRFSALEKRLLLANVSTIRKIQGGENDIVLVSLVRSDPKDTIGTTQERRSGIVSDGSLLLVALSRMKSKLFVVGNRRVLNDFVSEESDGLTRGMYEHVFSFIQKISGSFSVSTGPDRSEVAPKETKRLSLQPGEISCSAYSLRKYIQAGSVAIEAALEDAFKLREVPNTTERITVVNREDERSIEFFRRVSKGREVWAIRDVDRKVLFDLLGLPIREQPQTTSLPVAADESITDQISVDESTLSTDRFVQERSDEELEEVLKELQKIDENAFLFGLKGKRVPYKKTQLKNDFARMLGETFDSVTADTLAQNLCRMENGSLEMLYRAGVLSEKEKDIFVNNRPTLLRRLARTDKARLRERLQQILDSFPGGEDETKEMLLEILLPFDVIEYFTKRVEKDYYNDQSLAIMLDAITGLPSFILNDPDALHHELYVALSIDEDTFGEDETEIMRIGKELEPELSTFRRSLKNNTAQIGLYDPVSGQTKTIQLFAETIMNLEKSITRNPLKGTLPMHSILFSFVRDFQAYIDRDELTVYTFSRDQAYMKDLFGFAFRRQKGIARDVIAYYEGFKRNRVVLFHEIAEYLIKKDVARAYLMESVLDEEARAWVDAHVEKNTAGKEYGYTQEQNFRHHYIIRAFSRAVFGIEDHQLTQKIKEEKERFEGFDASAVDSHPDEKILFPMPQIVRGPYRINGKLLYAETVPVSEIQSVLDAWFAVNEKRYFSRDQWDAYIAMNRKNQRKDFLQQIVTEDGTIIALAYFHKEVFGFDGKDRLCYVDDLREVSASFRAEGVGGILLAKTLFSVFHDPAVTDEDIFIVHPAEDRDYAEEGRRARNFFEQNGFQRMFLTAYQDRVHDDHGVDEYYSISRTRARRFMADFYRKAKTLVPEPSIQLELFEVQERQEENEFTLGDESPLRIEFEAGTFRDEYLNIIHSAYLRNRMKYFKRMHLSHEPGVQKLIVARAPEIVAIRRDGQIVIAEALLARCLRPGGEGREALAELESWIIPYSLFRESSDMQQVVDQAAVVFRNNLRLQAEKEKRIDEFASELSALDDPAAQNRVALTIEKIFWRLKYLFNDVSIDRDTYGDRVPEQFVALIEVLRREAISDDTGSDVLVALDTLMRQDPMLLWNALLGPLGIIQSFIDAQSFERVSQKNTFNALQKTLSLEQFNEFQQVPKLLPDMMKEAPGFDIYIDEELARNSLYSVIQDVIDAGIYTYGRDLDIRIRLLDERDEYARRAELILAMDDSKVTGANIFRFSSESDAFAFDVYLFGLFFDALLYKGIIVNESKISLADWLNKIGDLSFHVQLKESFEPAVKKHIKILIFRAAA